jgi:hypothetical protein
MTALIAFLLANKGLIATIAFLISEALGATPRIKANGILSLIILQVQAALKSQGAKDLTP